MRSSLVTAYAAALGTTVWATWLELDRLPRGGPPLAVEATQSKLVVPDDEWRAWARQRSAFQNQVVALMKARQPSPAGLAQSPSPADLAQSPSPAPRSTPVAEIASPPRPSLKPAGWIDVAMYGGPEEPVLPSPPAERGSFWTQILMLFEAASASPMAADDGNRHIVAAFYPSGDQQKATERNSASDTTVGRAGARDQSTGSGQNTDSQGNSVSDPGTGSESSTNNGTSSDNDRSVDDDRSARSDRGVAGDQGVGEDRGKADDHSSRADRDDHGDRGGRGDRGDRDGRGDHGDHGDRGGRGDHGDRGGRGDGDRGRD